MAERAAPLHIADIGTGSGAIAIALAAHLPAAQIDAIDISADALEVARHNLRLHNLAKRVRLLHGDLLGPLDAPTDLIVSNPPYTILSEVQPNVFAHEPHLALEGGPDGADLYRRLFADAPAKLRPGGALLCEIGSWQGEIVSALASAAFPDAEVRIFQDLAGRDRVVQAITPT
jgi:release factor glutamine methyltransferase